MTTMKRWLLALLVLTLPMAAFARHAELTDPDPIVVPAGVSKADVEKAVKVSLKDRGWTVKESGAGRVEGTYSKRDFKARIAVQYTTKDVRIAYLDSHGLDYEEKDGHKYIHGNYNKWTANLAKDIDVRMSRAQK